MTGHMLNQNDTECLSKSGGRVWLSADAEHAVGFVQVLNKIYCNSRGIRPSELHSPQVLFTNPGSRYLGHKGAMRPPGSVQIQINVPANFDNKSYGVVHFDSIMHVYLDCKSEKPLLAAALAPMATSVNICFRTPLMSPQWTSKFLCSGGFMSAKNSPLSTNPA